MQPPYRFSFRPPRSPSSRARENRRSLALYTSTAPPHRARWSDYKQAPTERQTSQSYNRFPTLTSCVVRSRSLTPTRRLLDLLYYYDIRLRGLAVLSFLEISAQSAAFVSVCLSAPLVWDPHLGAFAERSSAAALVHAAGGRGIAVALPLRRATNASTHSLRRPCFGSSRRGRQTRKQSERSALPTATPSRAGRTGPTGCQHPDGTRHEARLGPFRRGAPCAAWPEAERSHAALAASATDDPADDHHSEREPRVRLQLASPQPGLGQ